MIEGEDGGHVPYDKLVLRHGLRTPSSSRCRATIWKGVIAYRDLEDTERMMALPAAGQKVVVIGGGSVWGSKPPQAWPRAAWMSPWSISWAT